MGKKTLSFSTRLHENFSCVLYTFCKKQNHWLLPQYIGPSDKTRGYYQQRMITEEVCPRYDPFVSYLFSLLLFSHSYSTPIIFIPSSTYCARKQWCILFHNLPNQLDSSHLLWLLNTIGHEDATVCWFISFGYNDCSTIITFSTP